MGYEEIMANINGPWSNAACMGYCLIAMRRAGLRPTAQRRVGAGEERGRHSAAGERGRADEGVPPDEPARQ